MKIGDRVGSYDGTGIGTITGISGEYYEVTHDNGEVRYGSDEDIFPVQTGDFYATNDGYIEVH